jgi:subtilisin
MIFVASRKSSGSRVFFQSSRSATRDPVPAALLGTIQRRSPSERVARPDDPVVPDLVAPGVGTVSARPGGGFQSMDGTSMATPHVAGLAALLLEAKPTANVEELESALLGSCELPPGESPDRAGRGLPNGPLALDILTGQANV